MIIIINQNWNDILNKELKIKEIFKTSFSTQYIFKHTKNNIVLGQEVTYKPIKLEVYNNTNFELYVSYPKGKSYSQGHFPIDIDNYKIIE